MSFTETLEALGSWDLQLAEETPDEVIAQLGYFGHLVVVDGQVDVAATGNALLTGARYVGVCREKGKPGTFTRGGNGLLYWLGDEDDKGHVIETEISLTSATLAQVVTTLLPPTVTVGTVFAQADPAVRYTGKHVFQSRRKALAIALAPFGAELRVNANFTVDVGTPAQLYDTTLPLTSKPSPMIVRRGAGSDLDLVAVGGKVETEGAVYDYSSRIVLLGQTIGTGGEPDTVFATGALDAPSVPWKDPQGNPVRSTRLISESGETTGSVAARTQLQLNRFNRETAAVKVTAEDYEIAGGFGVGDSTYVYDPDSGIFDTANQVLFRGEPLHPAVVRVSSITTPIVEGMTVAWRTDAGVWLDVTPWVVWESAGSREITVGDLPKTLTRPSDPIQDRVDAARGNPSTKVPKTPTGLVLSTASTPNQKGRDSAVITATWDPVTQYVDDTTVALHHYELQYRPQFRSPAWTASFATTDLAADLLVDPALGYDVQVRAVSTGGIASAWSATQSIISAADSTGPATPSDPVVSQYLGLLRIYWNGLSSVGGPMPSDFNRVDVHVGTTSGFTASAATLVDSLSAPGFSHTTAPYGSTRYVRFIAYDHNGNPSSASATVSGATTQAADGDIATLNVGKLVSGTMTADVVMAGRHTTALTGARREMNAIGFQAFDAANNPLINLDGITNLLTGILKTALSGRRIEIGAGGAIGTIKFYSPSGAIGVLESYTASIGVEAIHISVPIASTSQAWNAVQVESGEKLYLSSGNVVAYVGGDDGSQTKGFTVGWVTNRATFANVPRLWLNQTESNYYHPPFGDMYVLERQTDGSLHIKMWIGEQGTINYYNAGQIFQIQERGFDNLYDSRFTIQSGALTQDVLFQWPNINGRMLLRTATGFASARLQLVNNYNYGSVVRFVSGADGSNQRTEITDANEVTLTDLHAAAFVVGSSETTKDRFAPLVGDSMAVVKTMPPERFHRRLRRDADGNDPAADSREEIGFRAERMPAEVVVPSSTGLAIDLTAVVARVVDALQGVDGRLAQLERSAA